MVVEKRTVAERDACEIEAVLSLDGEPPRACVIRDISEAGACLELAGDAVLPDRFVLAIPVDAEIVDKRDVELRWSRGRRNGVRFLMRP